MRSSLLPRFVFLLLFGCLPATQAANPNVLLILADDLAWSDPGCYGHPWHETPHIDALARSGIRFTRGYAPAPICSASRAAILTGKTTARLNFEFVTKNDAGSQEIEGHTKLTAPPFTLNLPLAEKTIPEYLNELGYRTAFYGKWHLNSHHNRYLGWSPTHGPRAQGFQIAEEDFGGHPYSWGKRTPVSIAEKGQFPTDSMIDKACRFLSNQSPDPFFLMVSMFHVHTPVRTECRWLIDQYDARIPEDSPARDKRLRYAAFVETLDHYVGLLLQALEESQQSKETLVVFLSDNGGHPEFTNNAPLRGSKWNLYEGGIRVPFIMRWPGHIPQQTITDTAVIGYDLLPTFVALAGGSATSIDGLDVSAMFEDPEREFNRDLIFHFPYYHPERGYNAAIETIGIGDFAVSQTHPQSALIRGDHKLLHFYETHSYEYYHLGADIGEQNSLTSKKAEFARDLRGQLIQQLRQSRARFPVKKVE